MYEFKVYVSDEEFLLFNQYTFLNSYRGKKTLLRYRLKILLLSAAVVLFAYIMERNFSVFLMIALGYAIYCIVAIAHSKKKFLKNLEKSIKMMKREGKLSYGSETIIKFDDEWIHEIAPDNETKTKYSQVEKIAVTDKAIFIYDTTNSAYIIPINVFASEAEKLNFIEFIRSKTNA